MLYSGVFGGGVGWVMFLIIILLSATVIWLSRFEGTCWCGAFDAGGLEGVGRSLRRAQRPGEG